MDSQPFIDRLLETENLTDNLEDDDANILLNWGLGQIDGLLLNVEDEDIAGAKINALMNFMRGVNTLVGNLSNVSLEDLSELINRYNVAFGKAVQSDNSGSDFTNQISQMQPGPAIQYLIEWLRTKE